MICGAGDAACGSLGLGQIDDGDAFISLGTASQLFVTTDTYRPGVETLIHAFAHGLGRWFQMAAMLNGASALAWWASICREEPGKLIAEAEAEGRRGSTLFLPYLAGERTPHNDASVRGSFHGLSADASRADLTRAVLEGVAFTLTDARDALRHAGSEIVERASPVAARKAASGHNSSPIPSTGRCCAIAMQPSAQPSALRGWLALA